MKIIKNKNRNEEDIANPFSRLSLYIILSGWIGFAVYVFIFFFGMEGQESEMFLSHFLSTEENGLRFRALVFFTPFITTVIGFLVNEREKFFRHSMSTEQSYRDLFENANDAIFLLDNNSTVTDANQKALILLGIDHATLIGSNLCAFVHEDEGELLTRAEKEDRFVCRIKNHEKWLFAEMSTSPVFHNDRFAGSRIIARDITDYKLMQEELSMAYEEMQTNLQKKNAELRRARKDLLFESYERKKAEEELQEFIMKKKFGKHADG